MKRDKISVISLGCPKNLVDTEHLVHLLQKNDFELTPEPQGSNTVIINTCGFVREAVKEAIEHILAVAQLKQDGLRRLVVYGCMVQRYGKSLKGVLPEVDAWFGVGRVQELIHYLKAQELQEMPCVKRPVPLPYLGQRLICTPFPMAYLKVAEGCDNRCSFCLIPKLRGRTRSYPIQELVEETKRLWEEKGVQEINLVSQDLTQYGSDLGLSQGLVRLLEALLKLEGPPWIRLMYMSPWGITQELASLFQTEERLCPYVDMPIQHIHPRILSLMHRPGPEVIKRAIELLRCGNREIAIRTTLMVGFPTESEEEFEDLYQFVRETRFMHLGVFIYSAEKGTRAERIRPRVKASVAKERRDELLRFQRSLSLEMNRRLIGQEIMTLVEGPHPETELLLVGRASFMAPEIDGQIIINKGHANLGQIAKVRITEAYEYDLVGEIVE